MHENAAGARGNRDVRGLDGPEGRLISPAVHRPPLPGGDRLSVGNRVNYSGRSVPSSPCGTKRAVGMMVSGGRVSLGLRENIMRCSLALEMKKG
ncbi:hypothetical protein ACQY74_003949 [Rhizobium leguminosarum bv. trifolii]